MIRTPTNQRLFRQRLPRKDLGVALVALVAFGLAWLVMNQVTTRTRPFEDPETGMRLSYPAGWGSVESLLDVLLKVEDPLTPSAFKTELTVESRLVDPASPPTLQALLDRRVAERGQLTGYHFLAEAEEELAGARAIRLEFAYVVQSIDQPRRAALPIVVRAREYIVVTADRSYYFSLAAPESDFERASAQFERVIRSVDLP